MKTFKFDGKKKQAKREEQQATGIMGLKFMQRGKQREKEALRVKANMAIKQIKGEDDYQTSESEKSDAE